MRRVTQLTLGVYLLGFAAAVLYLLLRVWPVPLTGSPKTFLSVDGQYLAAAALAGAMGSFIHVATSFVEYAGQRKLSAGWVWWYVFRPFIGSAVAMVVYFLIRAGLITGAGEHATESLNPYGIASMAALAGMFSKQATDKLREIFQNICSTSVSASTAPSPQSPPQESPL